MTHALIVGIHSSTHRCPAFLVSVIYRERSWVDCINVVLSGHGKENARRADPMFAKPILKSRLNSEELKG